MEITLKNYTKPDGQEIVIIECGYDSKLVNAIKKNTTNHRWNYEDKTWSISLKELPQVYDDMCEHHVTMADAIKDYLAEKCSTGNVYAEQVSPDIVYIQFDKRLKNVKEMLQKVRCKCELEENQFTMTLEAYNNLAQQIEKDSKINLFFRDNQNWKNEESEESTDIFKKIAKEGFKVKYKALGLDLIGACKIKLTYSRPYVLALAFPARTSYEYLNALRENVIGISYDKSLRSMKMMPHVVNTLVGFVGKSNVEMDDEVKKVLIHQINLEKDTKKRLKDIEPLYQHEFKTAPLPHQIEAFNEGCLRDKILIGDDPGLGKTFSAINVAVWRHHNSYVDKVLIVCGVNSVKYNWRNEIKQHSYESCVLFDGDSKKRIKLIRQWLGKEECKKEENKALFGIINIEALRSEDIIHELKNNVDMIIVDEIHKAKNAQSKQGKALRNLKAPYEIGLSGTPITNKLEDLWNILSWLDAEPRTFWFFKQDYCVMGGYQNKEVVGYKKVDDAHALLNDVMLRRRKEEVLNLPPKTYKTEFVELSAQQRKDYKDAEKGVLEKMNEILKSNNPLTYLLRLRQITSGEYAEENKDSKLNRVKEMLEEEIIPNGKKAIIFSQWSTVAKKYAEELKEYNPAFVIGETNLKQRQAEVDRFQNDDNCKIAIGTIGAMGTGLTMTKADYVFFIDKDWTEANNNQAEDRAHRIGTDHNVTIISMIAENTVDEHIEDALARKRELFNRIVEGQYVEKEDKKSLFLEIMGQ